LGRLLLLLLLLHLLRLHLLHHRGAAARDLPYPDVEGQVAVLGEAWRRRAVHECQALRHGEAILAALLHPAHRLGESGEYAVHRQGRRLLAGIEDRAVIAGQDIFDERCISAGNRLAGPGLYGAELEATLGHDRPERSGADPREADSCGNDQKKANPKRDRAPASSGAIGGFCGGHSGLTSKA